MNRCDRCKREITHPNAKYGPVCAKIMGVDEEYYRTDFSKVNWDPYEPNKKVSIFDTDRKKSLFFQLGTGMAVKNLTNPKVDKKNVDEKAYIAAMGYMMEALASNDTAKAADILSIARDILNGKPLILPVKGHRGGYTSKKPIKRSDDKNDTNSRWFAPSPTSPFAPSVGPFKMKQPELSAPLGKVKYNDDVINPLLSSPFKMSYDGIISLTQLEYDENQKYINKNGIKGIPMQQVGDGKYTYGYGHAVDSIKDAPKQADADGWMSVESALNLLADDIKYYEDYTNRLLRSQTNGNLENLRLKQNEFDALVLLCYNRPAAVLAIKKELIKERSKWEYESFFKTIMNDYPDNPKFNKGWENRTRKQLDIFFNK